MPSTKKITLDDLAMMVKHGFDAVDARFNKLENKVDGLGNKVDKIEKRFDTLENKVDKIEKRFDTLEDKFDTLEDIVVRSQKRRLEKVEIVVEKIKEALAVN